MKRNEASGRDPLGWAGSGLSDGRAADRQLASLRSQDVYKLHEMRHKLDDTTYVDDAVTRIANFLTSTLKKKDAEERKQ